MALSRLSSFLSCQEDSSFRVVPFLGWLVSGAKSRWKALATRKPSEGRQCSTSGRTKVKRQGPCCTWCCWRSEARATDSRQARWVKVRASGRPMAEERRSLQRRCFSPGRADKWIKWIPAVVLYLSWVKSPWGLSLWLLRLQAEFRFYHLIFLLWPVILFHYKSARSCVSELTASHEARQEPTQEVCIVPSCNSWTLWCMQPVLRKPTASLPSKVSSTEVAFCTAFI